MGRAGSRSGRVGGLYAEVRAGNRGEGWAMMVVDLTAVALAGLLLVLVAYLRTGTPARDAPESRGSAIEGPVQAPGRTPAKGGDGGTAGLPMRDLDDALRITGGSRDIADALLEQMLAELPMQIEALTAAVAGGDWGEAGSAANGIRGATAACAVPALHAAVCGLQEAARREDVGAVTAGIAEVDRERRRLISPDSTRGRTAALAQASAR